MADETSRKFLVIGCGSIGKRHIGNLLSLNAGEVIAFDPSPERRAEAKQKFSITTFENLDAAYAEEPDAALITAPTNLHLPLALEAARQGCHLFIEKPLSDSLEGVDELLPEIQQRELISLIGCNLRFHPGLIKVRELITQDVIGKICSARAEFGFHLPDWHPTEDYRKNYSARRDMGGGVVLDAIHELDYIRWLAGEVADVKSFTGTVSDLEIDTEDMATIILRFASGAMGEVHLDYIQREYRRVCEIVGDAGTIHWDFVTGAVRCFTAASGAWQDFAKPDGWELNQMYVDEMRHFVDCLNGDATPTLDAEDARRVLEIALVARDGGSLAS